MLPLLILDKENGLLPKIIRPQAEVKIVTDLQSLAASKQLAKDLEKAEVKQSQAVTETETAHATKEVKKLRGQMRELLALIKESTLVFVLQGLNASAWTQIISSHTRNENGSQIQDLNSVLIDAIPRMLVRAYMETTPDETVVATDQQVADFLQELPDSSLLTLLPDVQALNTPVVSLPKA